MHKHPAHLHPDRRLRQPWERAAKSLPRFLAWCGLRAAVRHVPGALGRSPVALALVLQPGADGDAYAKAARLLFEDPAGNRYGEGDTAVFAREGAGRKTPQADDELSRSLVTTPRNFLVAGKEADVPAAFAAAADAVIPVGAVTERHLLAAARLVLKVPMTREQAAEIAGMPFGTACAALRPGRPVGAAIASMRRLEGVTAAATHPSGPRLEDLHGLGDAGLWGRELVADVADWRAGRIAWSEVDRGVLVSGPPGTGKTSFALALARSAGMHLVLGSLARWQSTGRLNDLLRAMRAAFDEARVNAPAIVFIDEVDSFGDRANFTGEFAQYSNEVVAGLLECIDGAEGKEGVVVIGATNFPARLDPALLRPGRLDRHVVMPLPDGLARDGILRWHLAGRLAGADLGAVVARTEGWTGAALEQLVRQASRRARRNRAILAVTDLVASLPERIAFPRETIRRMAVHEAGHAVLARLLFPGSLKSVGIVKDYVPGSVGALDGGLTSYRTGGPGVTVKSVMLDYVAVTLAGTAAEELVFGHRSTGSGGSSASDLHQATLDILRIEASYGLGKTLAYFAAADDEAGLLAAMHTDQRLRTRVEEHLRVQCGRAAHLLQPRSAFLLAVARDLEVMGRLGQADIDALDPAETANA